VLFCVKILLTIKGDIGFFSKFDQLANGLVVLGRSKKDREQKKRKERKKITQKRKKEK